MWPRLIYKLVWQFREHEMAAPFAADVIGKEALVQQVSEILAAPEELTYLRIEWKQWEKKR